MNELMGNKMIRYAVLSVLVLLSLFLLVKTWDAAFGKGQFDQTNAITVEGKGEVSLVPDVAQISFTITESATTVAAAQDSATKKTDAAIEALKKIGIADKDVKTVSYNVSPKYDYSQPCGPGMICTTVVTSSPKIIGYDVSQSIEVKVRDTAKAGDTLAALGTLGVQNISGPNFMVDDEDAAKAQAREQAIDEARTKAKVLAKQLGVRLGRVISYSEGNNGYPQPMMYTANMKSGGAMDARVESAPSLPTGENKTTVSVSVTYEIR